MGTALLLSLDNTLKKKIFFIDFFEGLPEVSHHDTYWKKGDMRKTNFDEINQFALSHLTQTPYQLIKGFFPQAIGLKALLDQLALVRLDIDLYQPTLDGLQIFYSQFAVGNVNRRLWQSFLPQCRIGCLERNHETEHLF